MGGTSISVNQLASMTPEQFATWELNNLGPADYGPTITDSTASSLALGENLTFSAVGNAISSGAAAVGNAASNGLTGLAKTLGQTLANLLGPLWWVIALVAVVAIAVLFLK